MQHAEPGATADRQAPTWKKVVFHFTLWLVIRGFGCHVGHHAARA
jgi:hypothetical protein